MFQQIRLHVLCNVHKSNVRKLIINRVTKIIKCFERVSAPSQIFSFMVMSNLYHISNQRMFNVTLAQAIHKSIISLQFWIIQPSHETIVWKTCDFYRVSHNTPTSNINQYTINMITIQECLIVSSCSIQLYNVLYKFIKK